MVFAKEGDLVTGDTEEGVIAKQTRSSEGPLLCSFSRATGMGVGEESLKFADGGFTFMFNEFQKMKKT